MPHSTMLDLPALPARLRTTLDLSARQHAMKTHFLQQNSLLAIWRTLALRRDFADTAFELSPAGDILVRDEDPGIKYLKPTCSANSLRNWVPAWRYASHCHLVFRCPGS